MLFTLLASLPPPCEALRGSLNEVVDLGDVSVIKESDRRYRNLRFVVLEIACGRGSVISGACQECDFN